MDQQETRQGALERPVSGKNGLFNALSHEPHNGYARESNVFPLDEGFPIPSTL